MSILNRASMAIGAALGLLASQSIGSAVAVGRNNEIKPRPSRGTQQWGHGAYGYPQGPGWTAAHVKRMSQKRRNQQRHKAACRRSGGR